MALDGDILGTAIKNAIKAWNSNPMSSAQEATLEEGWQVIANEIVYHFNNYWFRNCPIGSIIAWHKNLSGTPSLLDNWVECNGQTISDIESPYNGQVIPNLNGYSGGADLYDGVNDNLGKTGEIFLKGDMTSGKTEFDRFQGHWHNMVREAGGAAQNRLDASANGNNTIVDDLINKNTARAPVTDGVHGIPRLGADTKPRSFSIVFIMRIK